MGSLSNLVDLITVIIYFFIESIIIGFCVYLAWICGLQRLFFNFEITYTNWILIIWVIKIISFNIFNYLSAVNPPVININSEIPVKEV